jgi:K+-transporting ATPase ATPase C chain
MPILRPCLILMAVFTVLTGMLYPLLVTIAAQVAFPDQATGSLVLDRGRIVGSRLIGQAANGPGWFWPRPSAVNWNAAGSGGANLAPVTLPQRQARADRAATLRTSGIQGTLPADLVTASGSGLDPHLSPEAALIQVPRIAAAHGLDPGRLRRLVAERTEPPQFGLLGAKRVNVLELNRALVILASGGP